MTDTQPKEVTDPALLEQLNAPPQEVTDPELLRQLDGGIDREAAEPEVTYRAAMLPYVETSDGESGFGWPAMLAEPAAAAKRLFMDGNFNKGPDDPQNADDMRLLLPFLAGSPAPGAAKQIVAGAAKPTGSPTVAAAPATVSARDAAIEAAERVGATIPEGVASDSLHD